MSGPIASEHFRSVVFSIKTDTKQMGLLIELRTLLQFLIDGREVTTHERALAGVLTARINEGQQQRLPFVVVNANGFTVLIDKAVVGEFGARLWTYSFAGRTGCFSALLRYYDIFEPRLRPVNNIRSGNLIAGRELVGRLKDPGRLLADRKRHSHCGHVIFNLFMSDCNEAFVFL